MRGRTTTRTIVVWSLSVRFCGPGRIHQQRAKDCFTATGVPATVLYPVICETVSAFTAGQGVGYVVPFQQLSTLTGTSAPRPQSCWQLTLLVPVRLPKLSA